MMLSGLLNREVQKSLDYITKLYRHDATEKGSLGRINSRPHERGLSFKGGSHNS